MKPLLDQTGVQIETFQEIFDRLVAGYREIYGQNIDLSQNTPDGQRIGIEARAILESQEFGAALANSFDPDFAQGLALQKIAKLIGIFPRPATKSQWDLTVNTNRSVTLQAGYLIEDDLGQEWEVITPASLTSGANTVTFRAVEFGAVQGLQNAEITPVSIVLGVTSITAPDDSTVGIEEESDTEFRLRRARSLELPALSTVGALFSRIVNLNGVTDAVIYENDTSVEDTDRDILPHTIWLIVEGGDVADIADTIIRQKTGGTGLKGSIETQIIETITRPDATTFDLPYIARFDRPSTVDFYINLTVTRKEAASPVDVQQIKNRLLTYRFNIGKGVQAAELYSLALLDNANYILTDLEISDDGSNFTESKLTPALDEKYQLSIDDINITEITP